MHKVKVRYVLNGVEQWVTVEASNANFAREQVEKDFPGCTVVDILALPARR